MIGRFEEALQIIVPLLPGGRADVGGTYHAARNLEQRPVGPRPGRIPIMIGSRARRRCSEHLLRGSAEEIADDSAPATSARIRSRAQPSQNDRDEPADRGFGRQAAGRRQGAEAVAHELIGCDVIPDIAALRCIGQQVPKEHAQLMLRPGDMLALMDECRQVGALVPRGPSRG